MVIRNIGLMLSGMLEKPILDADTVVAEGGRIVAVGREKDCDTEQARVGDRRAGLCAGARLDRQPCASGGRGLDAAAGAVGVDREHAEWRRDDDDLRGPRCIRRVGRATLSG